MTSRTHRLLAWTAPATLALTALAPALPAQAAKPQPTPTVGPVDKDLNGDGVNNCSQLSGL